MKELLQVIGFVLGLLVFSCVSLFAGWLTLSLGVGLAWRIFKWAAGIA